MYGNNACICLPYCMNKDLGRVSAVVKLRLRHRAQTMARAYKLHTKMTLRSVVPGRRASGPHLGLIPNPPLADLWPALLPVSYRHRRTPKLHQRCSRGASECWRGTLEWCMSKEVVWRMPAATCRHIASSYPPMRGVQQASVWGL